MRKSIVSVRFVFFALLTLTLNVFHAYAQWDQHAKITLKKKSATAMPGEQFAIQALVRVDPNWHINSDTPHDETLIATTVTAKGTSVALVKVDYPKSEDIKLGFSEQPVAVFEGENLFTLTLRVSDKAPVGKETVQIALNYQACDNQSCMPPTTATATLTVQITESPGLKEKRSEAEIAVPPADSGSFVPLGAAPAGSVASTAAEDDSIGSMLEKSGMFLSLLLIFIAGLALNLTPCVYPLIPITIGYFGGQSEGSTGRLFLLGVLYMLGMAVTYSVVGVVTSLSGAMFGALLQNIYVIIGISMLFVVLALSQFGVYEFKLPDSWMAAAGGAKTGAYGAFFMGLTMGIVAAPCIGPFVLGLVTYVAAKGDPFQGFLMFFVLALGLGFPYLFLALFSGKIKNLPRSGVWMEGVKHLFGFLLLGMALYFVDPILPKSVNSYVLPVYGIVAALILLLVDKTGNKVKGFRIFKIVFSVVALVVCVYALVPSKKSSPDWQKFSEAAYEASLKNKERMIIDFYADWCIPCKELDALTFSKPNVIDESKRFTAYKADLTKSGTEEVDNLVTRFQIKGVPTVLIVDSQGKEVERITGFVNAEEFMKLIKAVE
jgi:thiol:disulfide interchange protein DsbD